MSNANKLARHALALRHTKPTLAAHLWELAKAQAAYQQGARPC